MKKQNAAAKKAMQNSRTNEIRVSSSAVVNICVRVTKERFPDADVRCAANEDESGLHINVTISGNGSVLEMRDLRSELRQSVMVYAGISVAAVLIKFVV